MTTQLRRPDSDFLLPVLNWYFGCVLNNLLAISRQMLVNFKSEVGGCLGATFFN